MSVINRLVSVPNGPTVSANCPIFHERKWNFPIEIEDNVEHPEKTIVYNFILSKHHTIYIDKTIVFTVGHGAKIDKETHNHAYGKEDIIDILSKNEKFDYGLIFIKESSQLAENTTFEEEKEM